MTYNQIEELILYINDYSASDTQNSLDGWLDTGVDVVATYAEIVVSKEDYLTELLNKLPMGADLILIEAYNCFLQQGPMDDNTLLVKMFIKPL